MVLSLLSNNMKDTQLKNLLRKGIIKEAKKSDKLPWLVYNYKGKKLNPKDAGKGMSFDNITADDIEQYNEIADDYKKFLQKANKAIDTIKSDKMFKLWKQATDWMQDSKRQGPTDFPDFD